MPCSAPIYPYPPEACFWGYFLLRRCLKQDGGAEDKTKGRGSIMMREHTRRAGWTSGRGDTSREATGAPWSISPGRDAAAATDRTRRRALVALVALPLGSLLLFASLIYAVWETVSLTGLAPAYIVPTPLQVAREGAAELADGTLLANAATTLQEALGGFALAAVVAAVGGYAIAHVRPLELIAAPFVAASQAVPVVAVAPLIILLLGTGLRAKVAICAVVVVFPLLIATITGLRGVGRDYHDVARVFGASRLQTLWYVELPLAAPVLFGGLKLGLTLSIIGAVVGEFVSANSGLGFLVNSGIANFDKAAAYTALIALVALSIALYTSVTLLERIALRWQND